MGEQGPGRAHLQSVDAGAALPAPPTPRPGLTPEFSPRQHETETRIVHVLWLTSGLGCDGDTVALTAATNPSLEELLRGPLPGVPPMVLYNSMLAFENGEEFLTAFHDAAEGRLDPFILVLEGSVPNEAVNGEGHWAAMGVDASGQPILTCTWIDRLAPRAAAVLALGTCAAYGGIPAMRNNPTGAMGLRDYLGASWKSRMGLPIVNLPGCPVQPDNITEVLLDLICHLSGTAPPLDLDAQGRPRRLFSRTVHEGCDRAGFADHAQFSITHGDGRCLVRLGCKGPVVKCNVPLRGWVNGIGGCPNVGGICMACTMPGFPDRYMPFVKPDATARVAAVATRFTYGAVLKRLRDRAIRRTYDVEPEWRRPAPELVSGYQQRW
ncbi:MAG TPA: hydrogenase expression protein HypE [Solirubrobacteraceae bacterium]|jgi:hydrogenase small subunit|nr:hydrogenase expression protein HypE [Solirubrobacteraceae bacterium]